MEANLISNQEKNQALLMMKNEFLENVNLEDIVYNQPQKHYKSPISPEKPPLEVHHFYSRPAREEIDKHALERPVPH